MVKIRLTRLGKHKMPYYRMVAIDSRAKRDGGYIALLGTIEPRKKIVKINSSLLLDFLNKGAQPSEIVINLLKTQGIWTQYLKDKKISAKKKHKRPTKKIVSKPTK